jgi:glutamine amidotransferase-like uncharacterized protein
LQLGWIASTDRAFSGQLLRRESTKTLGASRKPLQLRYNRSLNLSERSLFMGAATARLVLTTLCAVLIATALTACRAAGDEARMPQHANIGPILLFNGTGTSPGDVAALEKILSSEHLNYSTVNSPQLNGMSGSQIGEYRLLIVPGGNFEHIGNSLTLSTTANIHNAVENGLNYLGICAGAFFAGKSPYNGLNLTSGSRFEFYAAEARGIRKTAAAITAAGGQTLDEYWEDGPQLTGWGAVVGKYPDGTSAIVEGTFGNGLVILTGVHPEAPASWRRGMDFRTPVNIDNAYAATLIRAALNRELLQHY